MTRYVVEIIEENPPRDQYTDRRWITVYADREKDARADAEAYIRDGEIIGEIEIRDA